MAETVQFDLVSPERKLLSTAAQSVRLPGAEGDMTALPDHSPLISTLRPGIVGVASGEGEQEFVVTGGFVEISPDSIVVLAEQAVPRADMTQDHFDTMIAEANDRLRRAQESYQNEPGPVDEAAKLLADMVAVGGEIGLNAD